MQFSLDEIAKTIDKASDENNADVLNQSLSKIDEFLSKDLSPIENAQLHFFSANCYSAKRIIEGNTDSWSWEDEYLEKEIYHLRLSLLACKSVPFEEDGSDLRFRVETNLANALNHVGRFVEAIESWDTVLNTSPSYAMALGNKGHCLSWYARYLYDFGHQPIFLNESYHQIKKALNLGVEDHAAQGMRSWLEHLSSVANWNEFEFKPKEESRGKSRLERYYRTWCIEKRLFLNPLNDIWEKDIVANDVLTFPSIVTPVTDRKLMFPEVYGVYNQLKQEFVSTRYILFEAISESENKLHFSDKRVKLYDMLDFRKYRLWIEKLKMAFLSAYAIFDKIAYLINEHWGLSINVEKVSFRTVWYELGGGKRQISKKFHNSENWPLRGLYWLSKDLFFRANDYFSIEPDARHLNHIRNHITHKYLRVYDDLYVDAKLSRENDGHQLSYPIGHEELKLQSIKLLKLVRSALIYLSLAAHAEESRAKQKIDKGLIAAMNLCEIKDTYRL